MEWDNGSNEEYEFLKNLIRKYNGIEDIDLNKPYLEINDNN